MGGGTSLKHWFTSSVKKQCAKGFKLGTGPHKCAQWRRIGFYGSCLRVRQSDSELAWPVPQALMATMKLQVMKVPVASRVAGPEWPPCYVFNSSSSLHFDRSTGQQLPANVSQPGFSQSLQSCLGASATVPVTGTLRPGPGLPSGGPGRRCHGRRGRRRGSRARRPTPAARWRERGELTI